MVLALLFPQLETVVRQQSVELLPRDVPSFQTVDRMSAAFGEQGSKTMLFVAMEDPAGLTPAARQRYEQLVARLRGDTDHVLRVQDLLADPVTAAQAVSADRKAWYLPVGVAGTLGDPTAAESVQAVRAIVTEVFAGSTTTTYVTGPVFVAVSALRWRPGRSAWRSASPHPCPAEVRSDGRTLNTVAASRRIG